jgi:hypothetical protein
MSTGNKSARNEANFYTEAQSTYVNQDKSGRLNASTQNEVSTQSLVAPGIAVTNPNFPNPQSFLDNVANRYLI